MTTFGAHFLDDIQRRERAVEHLRSLIDLAPPDPRFTAAVYPHDPPASAQQMAETQSSCGLVCERGMDAAGVDSAVFAQPYGPRCTGKGPYAVVFQQAFARQHGAWVDTTHVDPDTFEPPKPGDMWLQGKGNAAFATPGWYKGSQARYEHVGTVEEQGDDLFFSAIEGGQPGVKRKARRWVVTPGGELWICGADVPLDGDSRPTKGARVQGYLVLTALPFREGM